MALPVVLAHKDFGDFNILVDTDSCHLLGVIDWAEAKLEPFGVNLSAVEKLMTKFHLRNGASRYPDYDTLFDAFWQTLKAETGPDLGNATVDVIRSAMLLGVLLEHGFTSRFANMPQPVPISDDGKKGTYKMLELDSFLSRAETRFPFLASMVRQWHNRIYEYLTQLIIPAATILPLHTFVTSWGFYQLKVI
jgi:hypothetical protein